MKVTMLKQTVWDDSLKVGDEVDVDDSVARRWINNKIAEPVIIKEDNRSNGDIQDIDNQTPMTTPEEGEKQGQVPKEPESIEADSQQPTELPENQDKQETPVIDPPGSEVDPAAESKPEIDQMTYAELRELAKQVGVDGYSKMNKEALVEALKGLV